MGGATKKKKVRGKQWVKEGMVMVLRESMPILPSYPRAEAARAGLAPVTHHESRPRE